jgi:hypothetical protein
MIIYEGKNGKARDFETDMIDAYEHKKKRKKERERAKKFYWRIIYWLKDNWDKIVGLLIKLKPGG